MIYPGLQQNRILRIPPNSYVFGSYREIIYKFNLKCCWLYQYNRSKNFVLWNEYHKASRQCQLFILLLSRGDILGGNWDKNLKLLLHAIHSHLLPLILPPPPQWFSGLKLFTFESSIVLSFYCSLQYLYINTYFTYRSNN